MIIKNEHHQIPGDHLYSQSIFYVSNQKMPKCTWPILAQPAKQTACVASPKTTAVLSSLALDHDHLTPHLLQWTDAAAMRSHHGGEKGEPTCHGWRRHTSGRVHALDGSVDDCVASWGVRWKGLTSTWAKTWSNGTSRRFRSIWYIKIS